MPPKFRLSGPASADTDAIWDDVFFRSRSLEVADKVLHRLYEAFDVLSAAPQAGHVRDDLIDKPVKFWSVYSYLIVYKPDTQPIEIVAVIHGASDAQALLPSIDLESSGDI
jgi:plasmid stabilization system protein ParE